MLDAPAADHFPAYPASWYLFCRSSDLRRGPLSRALLGRELTAFRTASGRAAVLDARCAHQGANLGHGRVAGEAIACPFHNWEYGPDGRCVRIPAQSCIPAFARQAAYPVVERHGYVFFFNGARPWFDLPFVPGCRPGDFTAGRAFTLFADCPWYMFSA